jgi:hypothetical protein
MVVPAGTNATPILFSPRSSPNSAPLMRRVPRAPSSQ